MDTYEQKYREALKKAEAFYYSATTELITEREILANIFPELIQEEDEMIRKELITHCRNTRCVTEEGAERIAKWISWLEKQREQKPDDYENANIQQNDFAPNVEPKFKIGDWVVCEVTGSVYQIRNCIEHLSNYKYGYVLTNGDYIGSDEVNHYHLWTIKDAKDGDVLFHSDSASNGIFIFKELLKYEFSEKVICYCDYDSEDYFCLGEHHTCCWADAKILHPATKKQRDLLFNKMKEAGYEWDAEKKELKKIKQTLT